MTRRAHELTTICRSAAWSEPDLASALALACGHAQSETERCYTYHLTVELWGRDRAGFAADLAQVLWP